MDDRVPLPRQFRWAICSCAPEKGKSSACFCISTYVLTASLHTHLLIVSNRFLAQIMIVDYKLTYPSGTATAYLINGFHTPEGAKLAK